MTPKQNKSILTAVLAVAVVTACTVALRSRPDNAARHEVWTAQQIEERSAPICRLLAIHQNDLRQVAESLDRISPDGTRHKIWAVDCIDGQGRPMVHTVWDAETGNLIVAAHEPHRGTKEMAATVKVDSAAKIAWRWMEELGVGRTAARWTVAQTPHVKGNSWMVVLHSPQYDATVIIDKKTQDLVYLTVKQMPPAHAS
jgi:hypothetical protein